MCYFIVHVQLNLLTSKIRISTSFYLNLLTVIYETMIDNMIVMQTFFVS